MSGAGVSVLLQLFGNATWLSSSSTRQAGQAPHTRDGSAGRAPTNGSEQVIAVRSTNGGFFSGFTDRGWATFRVDGDGAIGVQPFEIYSTGNEFSGGFDGPYLFVNTDCQSGGGGQPVGSPVSKLLLLPAKAYRHVHDPITVTAIALDANKAPVPNAQVVLAAYGDCEPWVNQGNATTNAAGQASFTIMSTKPGAVSVVAASVNTQGLPVVSYASHILFFEDHHYIDEREEQYYKGGDEPRDGEDYYG